MSGASHTRIILCLVWILTTVSGHGNIRRRLQSYATIPDFSCYKSLQGTIDWMNAMVAQANAIPNLHVAITDIGDSFLKTTNASLGHDIWALNITGKYAAAEKGVFFAMSGVHGREYPSTELVSRWAESLIDVYGTNADTTALLDYTEIHMVVQANPDGRQVAEAVATRSALRGKNLNPHGSTCSDGNSGVDLNRNFPFGWGLDGSDAGPCQEQYRGPSAASEPEVQAIMSYCKSIFPTAQRKTEPEMQAPLQGYDPATTKGVFLDLHAGGEFIYWPWYYATDPNTMNTNGFETLAREYQHFNGYTYAPRTFRAAGNSIDWAYGALGVAAMAMELGTAFNQDCADFEANILASNLEVLTYAAKTSMAPYTLSRGPEVTRLVTELNEDELNVTAAASDWAYSPSGPMSDVHQLASIIFASIDEYPQIAGHVGVLFSGHGVITLNISNLPEGSHLVYVQAMDTDNYTGPVTAASFTKVASVTQPCEDAQYVTLCPWVEAVLQDHPTFCQDFPSAASACRVTCNTCS